MHQRRGQLVRWTRTPKAGAWIVAGALLAGTAAARGEDPNLYGWPSLPTDSEIERARSTLEKSLTNRVLYIEAVKFHREVSFDGVDKTPSPLADNGVYLKYAEVTGDEAITVNGQLAGRSPRRELHRMTFLRYDADKGEFYFGVARFKGGFMPALGVIGAAAESKPEATAAALAQRIAAFHAEQVRDPGDGHVTKWHHVDGWCAGSVAGGMPSWVVVVGVGAGAVAAAAAAMAATAALVMRGRAKAARTAADRKDAAQDQDPQSPVGYILQLSAKTIAVAPGTPATLQIKAWRVDASGGYTDAPEARLALAPPRGLGLVASPAAGQGVMNTTITATGPLPSACRLAITATANGKTVTEAVEITPAGDAMTIEMDGEREESNRPDVTCTYVVRCDKATGQWHFSDLVVWFTEPGSSQPAPPKFKPLFGKPAVEPALPGLRIGDPVTTDNLTWHFKVSLDPAAAINEEWLAKDGRVYISVTCQEAPVSA